jgi:hypothetical protein
MHALPGKDVRGMTRVEARRLSVAGSHRTRTRQNDDFLYSVLRMRHRPSSLMSGIPGQFPAH